MEEFWYEWRPFIFLAAGATSLWFGHDTKLLMISGVLLFFASGFTLKARLDYRKGVKPKARGPSIPGGPKG